MVRAKSGEAVAVDLPALHAVGRLHRAVVSRARQGYAAQALCAAIGAGALSVSLGVLGGQGLEDLDLYVLASLLALSTFLAWRHATPLSASAAARRVDEGLSLGGAYVAAFEANSADQPSVMSELGAQRVLTRLRRREAVEVAVPHTVSFVAVPLLALALLAVSVGLEESSGSTAGGDRARTYAFSADLASLAREGAVPMDEAAREAIQRAADAAVASASSKQRPQEMRDLAEELEALALEAPHGSQLAEALARAAAAAESVALEPGQSEGSLDADRQAATGERNEDRSGEARSDEGGADREGGEGAGPASGISVGTSSLPDAGGPGGDEERVPRSPAGGPGEAAPEAAALEAATLATMDGRWWDPRDDGIVSGWVALQLVAPAAAADGQ